MAQQTLQNGETGLVIRGKINDNFTELYGTYDGLTSVWITAAPAVAGDNTVVLQTTLDTAFATFRNVEIPAGEYEVSTIDLPGSSAERGKAIQISGQGCGEAFVTAALQEGTIWQGTSAGAPTFQYVPDVVNTGNGMAIVEKIRFEGTTSTPVVDFDTFYSQSQFRQNVIYQYGTGDGLRIKMSNTIRVHDNYVLNNDWNNSGEISRTGIGVHITSSLTGGAGLTTLEKITSRGFLWGYKFGASNNGSPGALYTFELSDSEVSVCTNGVWITNDCRSFSLNNCYLEGLKGGTAVLDEGQYSDVTGNLAFEGFSVGIDSPNTTFGGYYAGNVFSAGYRSDTTMLKLASSGSGGGVRKSAIGNTLVFPGSFFTYAWTASISGTTMTVTAVSQGPIRKGMELTGSGVTAGTEIVQQLTGTTDGIGTYEVSISQTVGSTTINGKITNVVGVDIQGVDPGIDIIGLACDPRGAWEGTAGAGTGTRKFKDTSTDSQGTTGSGLVGLAYSESKNKAWMVPALRRGAIQLKTDPTALVDADVAAGVLTLSELSMMTLTLAGATNITSFAAPNLPDKTFGIRVTNGNTTFVHGASIKLAGSANWTPGANGGLIMFQIWPGGIAWEISRTAY